MTGSPDAAPTPVRTLGADTPPKVGDRVRVVLEGDHAGNSLLAPGAFYIVGALGLKSFVPPGVSVEVLTPPAPTYVDGDVVRSFSGTTYLRGPAGWISQWGSFTDRTPDGAVLIASGGKPVTP